MIDDILFWAFAASSIIYVAHLGFYLVGANLYDIWQFRRLHHHHRRNEYRAPPQHSLVTVLIPAHNEELVIERCLDSVRRSTYKNLEIVVVNDGSTDATQAILKLYQRRHRQLAMRAVKTKEQVGKGGALNYALKKFVKGELVMTLDADSVLSPRAIAHAVAYFADPQVVGVAANVRVMEEPTILGLLQKFEHMLGYRSKKVYSLTNCEFVIGGVASTYRMDVLRQVGFYDTDTMTEDIGLSMKIIGDGNRQCRLVYGADVEALTEGVHSFRTLFRQRYRWKYGALQNIIKHRHLIGRRHGHSTASLTLYRLPTAVMSEIMLLVTPLVWMYVVYATFVLHDLRLLVGAYITITAYTLVTLWFDEHTSFWHRLRLSLYAPLAYPSFYIMDIVQFVAASRCVYGIRNLLGQKSVVGKWVPPARAEREPVGG